MSPALIEPALAAHWFARLFEDVAWKNDRRTMYEREVEVPRLRAHFNVDDPTLLPVLREALDRVRAPTGTDFDSISLNLHRDQYDSVAPHNDTLADLVRGQPIALLSLGATRRMTVCVKKPPGV